jgi:hypothetical protein
VERASLPHKQAIATALSAALALEKDILSTIAAASLPNNKFIVTHLASWNTSRRIWRTVKLK